MIVVKEARRAVSIERRFRRASAYRCAIGLVLFFLRDVIVVIITLIIVVVLIILSIIVLTEVILLLNNYELFFAHFQFQFYEYKER